MIQLFENFKSLNKYKELISPLPSLFSVKLELLYFKNHAERETERDRERQRRREDKFSHSTSIIIILFSFLNLGFLL